MSDEVLSVERIIEIIEENKRREDRFISEDLMDYPKALENFMKTYFVPDETRALFYKLAKEDKLFREVYTFFHDIYGENWMFKYYKNLLPRNSIRFTDYFQILTNFIRMAYNLLGFKDSDFSMLKPEQVEFCELEACTEYFYFNDKHWIILDRESPFKIEEGIYHEGIHVLFNLLIKKNESNTYSDIFITNPSKFSSSQIFYLKVLNESFTLFMQQHLFGEESLLPLKERYSLNKLGDDLDSDSSILSKVSKSNAIIKKLVEDSKMQIKLARERFSYLASKEITEESDLLECMELLVYLGEECQASSYISMSDFNVKVLAVDLQNKLSQRYEHPNQAKNLLLECFLEPLRRLNPSRLVSYSPHKMYLKALKPELVLDLGR